MKGAALALLVLTLTACASRELVVLLPGQGGSSGALSVTPDGGSTVLLDRAHAAARTTALGGLGREELDADAARAEFADALSAMPKPPASYTVYFEFGTVELTPDSAELLSAALADLRDRAGAEIELVGHTDRAGSVADNDHLSRSRALMVLRQLREIVDSALITTSGRGEREPLVPTDDDVAEPRNRRVEIIVR